MPVKKLKTNSKKATKQTQLISSDSSEKLIDEDDDADVEDLQQCKFICLIKCHR